MRLCIRQRMFSWTDSYDVYDEWGNPKYFVKAEFFTFGHQIHVYEKATGREVGSIHQKLFTMLPTFEIYIGGQYFGLIRKRFRFFRQDYEMEYRGWRVEGDFMGWDYRVIQNNLVVLSISKELFRWSDTYVLNFRNPEDEISGLLLVIAIDAANCEGKD